MDINDLHPADDYTNRFFIWHEWIQANGPLTAENVFDYFSYSMFYDKQSNNQVLRMQTMHTGMPIENEAEELKRFTGVEFAVVHAQPPSFFIIQKRNRLSPEEVKPLAAYFVMNNRIYQSPDMYSLLSNRLLASVSALQTSLDTLRKHRPDYTPRQGFVWPIVGDETPDDASRKKVAASDKAETSTSNAPMAEPSTAPSPPTQGSVDADTQPSQANPTKSQLSTTTTAAATAVLRGSTSTSASGKRVNTALLLNAMRTTAMNSKIQAPSSAALIASESVPPSAGATTAAETPAQVSSSTTPAPGQQEREIKGTPGDAAAAKAAKKKRKRSVQVQP
ncbi:hypothetical protein NMY22_g5587 [Coprinellus aureogranulatus]|nr:hypothetical protein NMY22_g5587 [Coprinellus aureogranulatus]